MQQREHNAAVTLTSADGCTKLVSLWILVAFRFCTNGLRVVGMLACIFSNLCQRNIMSREHKDSCS